MRRVEGSGASHIFLASDKRERECWRRLVVQSKTCKVPGDQAAIGKLEVSEEMCRKRCATTEHVHMSLGRIDFTLDGEL